MILIASSILLLIITVSGNELSNRDQACNLLIAYDDTVYSSYDSNVTAIKEKVKYYVQNLNKIYADTVLRDAPNEKIYFRVGKLVYIQNFAPNCNNPAVILDEFTKAIDASDYCLAHLFTIRDLECVYGLANVGKVCSDFANTGFTRLERSNDSATILTLAHEIGHNLGSHHDGENTTAYSRCTKESNNYGIMGGEYSWKNFSTCSVAGMLSVLQHIHLKAENESSAYASCFKPIPFAAADVILEDNISLHKRDLSCPDPDPNEYGQDCGDNPDPPKPPEPPEPPVCGNKKLEEPQEECDCGKTKEECDDPCCYPAILTEEDLQANKTAKSCRRHTSGLCQTPNASTFKYGIVIPLVAFLIGILLLALILCVDWRYGKRLCYSHILERPEELRIEDENQRLRRLRRGNVM
jgi:hypothetical protein